jgi:hypothetical protein
MLGHAERTEHDVARRERSRDRHHRQRQTRLLLGHPSEPSRKILENRHHLRCTNLCFPLGIRTLVGPLSVSLGVSIASSPWLAR